MVSPSDITAIEKRLSEAFAQRRKNRAGDATLIEIIDEFEIWPVPFNQLGPIDKDNSFDHLFRRAPNLICAVAAETGFRFEGVGTEFWAKFEGYLGQAVSTSQRQMIGAKFSELASTYSLIRPADSQFTEHFSIIAWPIANALLPIDLVAPVTRLLARAPVGSLPSAGGSPDFSSMRAWASATEGARLLDWLRIEVSATKVLASILENNANAALPNATYYRLQEAIQNSSEAYFAKRAAQSRARGSSKTKTSDSQGQLMVSLVGGTGSLFVTWPALSPAVLDKARAIARAKNWRPKLWGAGALLHPDSALSSGPIKIALPSVPGNEDPAYPDIGEVFGQGSEIFAALNARKINWAPLLLFEPSEDRRRAEQLFQPLSGREALVWVAISRDNASLSGLRMIGTASGYDIFEADLRVPGDKDFLIREKLLDDRPHLCIARHPIDAIISTRSEVRASRSFLVYSESGADIAIGEIRTIDSGSQDIALPDVSGHIVVHAGAVTTQIAPPVEITIFERETAYEALIERRLQIRIDTSLPLIDVRCKIDLEICGVLISSSTTRFAELPVTIPATSPLLAVLYDDSVRERLLLVGEGILTVTVGSFSSVQVRLKRTEASVQWFENQPTLTGSALECRLSAATARLPHRFIGANSVEYPARGASAFGLVGRDGRIADPLLVLTSNTFSLDDLTANFSGDIGSRLLLDDGRGVAEIARARVAWAKAQCNTLAGLMAKARVVEQFEPVLVADLCGREWLSAENASTSEFINDYHLALWELALAHNLVVLPEGTDESEVEVFAYAFVEHMIRLDPDWPVVREIPNEGAIDDALNSAFSDALGELHQRGSLAQVEDDFDFGRPSDDWLPIVREAINAIERPSLVALLAPSGGAQALRRKNYRELVIPELAEDLSAWTQTWALSRGRLSIDDVNQVLQLWLSPGVCEDAAGAVRLIARDPFVARATRYAALRLRA